MYSIPFVLLLAAMMSLWLPRARRLWPYLTAASVLAAWSVGVANAVALLGIISLLLACYALKRYECVGGVRYGVSLTAVMLTSLALAIHMVPGFQVWVLYPSLQFSADSAEYILRYGYDKAIVALVLLAMLASLVSKREEWRALLKPLPLILLAVALAVFSLGMLSGYLAFDVKLSSLILLWALGNLFITCAAEEAFFRLLIQKPMQEKLQHLRYGVAMTLCSCAVLFGLVHIAGGWMMVVGATAAGFGYAYAYYKTGRLEAAIAVHFSLNLCHFVFFTYPRDIGFSV